VQLVLLHVLEQIILKDLLFLNRDETLAAKNTSFFGRQMVDKD
jgi:hypothetical protein